MFHVLTTTSRFIFFRFTFHYFQVVPAESIIVKVVILSMRHQIPLPIVVYRYFILLTVLSTPIHISRKEYLQKIEIDVLCSCIKTKY